MKILVINSKGGVGKSTIVMALADALDAQVVDTDHQGTLFKAAQVIPRHIPISMSKATGEHVIIDTPPYHDDTHIALLQAADIIIVPAKVSLSDLLASGAVLGEVERLGLEKKCLLVFNEVRKPHNKTYRECLSLFDKNYGSIRRAETELSNLIGYRRILAESIAGQAKNEIMMLVAEIKSIYRG
jgi:cellulose biosynthesis protein BcsQ